MGPIYALFRRMSVKIWIVAWSHQLLLYIYTSTHIIKIIFFYSEHVIRTKCL